MKQIALNYHLTAKCNMRCAGCFAHFNECNTEKLTLANCQKVLKTIHEGVRHIPDRKLNFAGGEPTLIPFLDDLCQLARNFGFSTSLITNGSLLTERRIQKYAHLFDWIGISIDSLQPECDEDMKSSYLMIAPNGALFDNSEGKLAYSRPLWQVTWKEALNEIRFSYKKFRKRGGCYEWKLKR